MTSNQQVGSCGYRAGVPVQAILAKAFRGELVPTEAELPARKGRDYEPASALLERIRAERAQAHNGVAPGATRRSRHRAGKGM
jgi:type I restriction enzyme S subunit